MMEIKYIEKPKGVTLIQGYPGIGMVGSIVTEYLIENLNCKEIGIITYSDIEPMVAIHRGRVVPQIGIFYSEKYNLVILNFLTQGSNKEWEFSKLIQDVAWELSAKEIICLEGVAMECVDHEVYGYSTKKEILEVLNQKNIKLLEESVIMGVTAALLQKRQDLTSFFVTTCSQLPDSGAAAELVKVIDNYLNLNVDPKPLVEQAKQFEEKIKSILNGAKSIKQEKERKMTNYVS